MRYVMNDRISRVEERIARGEHAEFAPDSEGWYVTLEVQQRKSPLGQGSAGPEGW